MEHVKVWLTSNLSWLIIVGSVVFGSIYAYEVHSEHKRASCQIAYNKAFAVQLTERSRLASATTTAQTKILSDIGHALAAKPTKDPKVQEQRVKDFLRLFSDFDAVTDQITKDRDATPLPPIPDCH